MAPMLRQMEDDLNFLKTERRPQIFGKWKTTSIRWQMKDSLFLGKWNTPSMSFLMEDGHTLFQGKTVLSSNSFS